MAGAVKPLVLAGLFLLSGCITQVDDAKKQTITVLTPQVPGAECAFTNSRGDTWNLYETPGTVTVTRGGGRLTVICRKQGYIESVNLLDETEEGITRTEKITDYVGLAYYPLKDILKKYPNQMVIFMAVDPKKRYLVDGGEWKQDRFVYKDVPGLSKEAAQKQLEEENRKLEVARELLRARALVRRVELEKRNEE